MFRSMPHQRTRKNSPIKNRHISKEEYFKYIDTIEKMDLYPGFGKGKTAAVICMTKYISLSSKLISTKTYEIIKRYLIEILQYDKVFFASTFQGKTETHYEFFKDSTKRIEEEGCLDEADDIFQVQAALNMFLGWIYDDFYWNCLRVDEWYNKHKDNPDSHYFVIQDDPCIHFIDPFPVFTRRQFEYHTLGYKVPDWCYEKYKQIWPNVQECLHNCVVANCGSSYPNLLRKLSNTNELTPKFVKRWCEFPIFTFQAMNDIVDVKLKTYDYDKKEYDSEYHGYNRGAKRMELIDNFYSALPNKSLCITSSRNMFKNKDNYDMTKSLFYDDMIQYIGQKAKSTFIVADECTFNDFISPRFFDGMLSDVIAFVYGPYDKDRKYIDNEELKSFMYVDTPEEFAERVSKISNDKEYYQHIKYLQRKAVYEKYGHFCNKKSKKIFEDWLSNPDNIEPAHFGSPLALF